MVRPFNRVPRLSGWLALLAVVLVVVAWAEGAAAAPLGQVTEFPVPSDPGGGNTALMGIAAGPDGNLWFADQQGTGFGGPSKIGRITPQGSITLFPVLGSFGTGIPVEIAAGSDGNMWFTDFGAIGRITPQGSITEFRLPTGAIGEPQGIVAGADGNLWFADYSANAIGRITPQGSITLFPLSTPNSFPREIAAGPDGNVWFTEETGNKIGRITPQGSITEFPLPTPRSAPEAIAEGPDGNLWFSEIGGAVSRIGRITPQGSLTEFPLPTLSEPPGMAAGPDGNIWFTEVGAKIGRITPQGSITEFPIPNSAAQPRGIAAGPDGNMWFAEEFGNNIGRIGVGLPTVLVAAASGVGRTKATLNGTVNAQGARARAYFEYGTSTAYGMVTSSEAVDGTTPAPLSATVTGLAPSTTFHYRLVATNANGTSYSADEAFTTATPPPPSSLVSILTRSARVDLRGKTKVKLACGTGSGHCTGTLRLTLRIRVRVGLGHGAHLINRTLMLARASFTLASDERATVKLTLNPVGRRLLAGAPHYRLRMRGSAHTAVNTATVAITLKLVRPPRCADDCGDP